MCIRDRNYSDCIFREEGNFLIEVVVPRLLQMILKMRASSTRPNSSRKEVTTAITEEDDEEEADAGTGSLRSSKAVVRLEMGSGQATRLWKPQYDPFLVLASRASPASE